MTFIRLSTTKDCAGAEHAKVELPMLESRPSQKRNIRAGAVVGGLRGHLLEVNIRSQCMRLMSQLPSSPFLMTSFFAEALRLLRLAGNDSVETSVRREWRA